MKHAGWVVAALLLCLSGLLGWQVDRADAASDAYSEIDRLGMRSAMTLDVIRNDWIGRPEADLTDFARRMKVQGWLVKSHDDVVELDDLVFRTRDQRVVGVDFLR